MKKTVQILAGLALGGLLLWWVFRGTDWGEVWGALRTVHWGWLAVAEAFVVASFFVRILRWRYIVRTAKPVSFRSMFSATQIGFLANFVLPGRAGEVIRALVLSRLEKIPFSKCFAFVALDRVTDLFGMLAAMLVAVLAFRPDTAAAVSPEAHFPEWASPLLQPQAIRTAAFSAMLFMLVVVAAFVMLYVNQRLVLRWTERILGLVSQRLAERITGMLGHFAEGLHVFRAAGDMAKSLGFSMLTWVCFVLTFETLFRAFDIAAPWYTPFVTLSLVSLVISLPGAPGFIGQYHAAIWAALLICSPSINSNVVRAIAIMGHLINLIPVTLVGLYCLQTEKLGLFALKREGETASAAPE